MNNYISFWKRILFLYLYQNIVKVKWYPFTYHGEITDYEASNTGLIRNKNTKKIFEKSKPTLKKLKRLAKKGNGIFGEQYFRVSISNLKTRKVRKKKNLAVHKIIYCACNNIDYKDIPKNQQIDHINRCRFDNRITNLRCVSIRENCKNRDTKNLKDRCCTFPIYLYKYEDKMNGRKTRKHIFESKDDPEFINFKRKNKIPICAFSKEKNLIGGIKKTNKQRCLSLEKFAFYNENNKFVVEEILEEYIDEDKLEIIDKFKNAHNAAKFLEGNTEYDTGNSNSNTIRGRIHSSISKNKVIYGNIICKKGKKYTLKQGEITKDIKIGREIFQATSFGYILQDGKKCYTPIISCGYLIFKGELVHHIIYAAFNDLTIEELKQLLSPNGKKENVIDHKSQTNKTDNSISNLEMKTYSENTQSARDSGQIAGQVCGIIINETTGEKFSFNHLNQAARFLNKQKGFTNLKQSSLRDWIQKALKNGFTYLKDCKFMTNKTIFNYKVYEDKNKLHCLGTYISIKKAHNKNFEKIEYYCKNISKRKSNPKNYTGIRTNVFRKGNTFGKYFGLYWEQLVEENIMDVIKFEDINST